MFYIRPLVVDFFVPLTLINLLNSLWPLWLSMLVLFYHIFKQVSQLSGSDLTMPYLPVPCPCLIVWAGL